MYLLKKVCVRGGEDENLLNITRKKWDVSLYYVQPFQMSHTFDFWKQEKNLLRKKKDIL